MNDIKATLLEWCQRSIFLLLLLTVFIVPVFFGTWTNDVFETNKLFLFRLLTLSILALMTVQTAIKGEFRLPKTPLDLPFAGYFLAAVVATLHTVQPDISWFGQYENYFGLVNISHYIIFYYILVHSVDSRRRLTMVLGTLVFSGSMVTTYGLMQRLEMDPVPWNPLSIIVTRNFSTLGNPVFLAAFQIMVLPVVA